MTLSEALSDLLATLPQAPLTVRAYRSALDDFARSAGATTEVAQLSTAVILRWIKQLAKRGYSRSTYGVQTAALLKLLAYLDLEDLANLSLTKIRDAIRLYRPGAVQRVLRVPKADELAAMRQSVQTMEAKTPLRQRNVALIEILYCTGARIAEIAGLCVKDVDLESRTALVRGKGRRERLVFLSHDAARALTVYWSTRRNSERNAPALARHDDGAGQRALKPITTQGLRNIVNAVRDLAGVESITPHRFRHAFATKMLGETGNLALVQDTLGHASANSTRIYARVDVSDQQRAHSSAFNDSP